MGLNWVRKVFADERNNAFTDLTRWKDNYYIAFRNAEAHASFDGKIYILQSKDLKKWHLLTQIATENDARDAKFLATAEKLFLYFADCQEGEEGREKERWTFVTFSENGELFSQPERCSEKNYTFWRPKEFEGEFYVAAYFGYSRLEERHRQHLDLLKSKNAIEWEPVCRICSEKGPDEAAIHFLPSGKIMAIIRCEAEPYHSLLSFSSPPYRQWEHKDLGFILHSPAIIGVGKEVLVAGRFVQKFERKTALWLNH